MRSTRVPHACVPLSVRLPAVPTASMRPPPSRTSTVRPSVRRAPHSNSAAGSDGPGDDEDEEDDEWGGWG